MSRITRQQFVQQFGNKELNVNNAQIDDQARSAGVSTEGLRRADLNNDGKINGAEEVNKLFNYLDDFDRNGDRHSINTRQNSGNGATKSGKVYNFLSLQFAEAAGTTEVNGPTEASTKNELGQRFAEGGANSIDTKMGEHLRSLKETGVGTYFGDHSSMNKMSVAERQSWIDSNAIDGTQPPSASELKESSCIGWAMENVAEAYKAAGKTERWNEIKSIVRRDDMRGTTLAKELKKDGWESVYWNGNTANTSHNGEHSYSAAMVKRGKPYYGVDVDHQVLNYEKGDMSGIDQLKEVPFFFGLARGGSHTFVGRDGNVNEFHWSHMPDSDIAIEETPLKDWGWGSGLIMVPPGSWPN